MRGSVMAAGVVAAWLPFVASQPALTRVEVSLGDVSINKVPQLVAADQGIYAKYGLDVHQTISSGAARAAAASGVVVPDAYINRASGTPAAIEVGGGSPMIYGVITKGATPRVIVLTQEPMAMDHVIARSGLAGLQDLKGKRLGYSGDGAVTHFSALALARRFGWTPGRDLTLVPGSASLDALKADRVDAILGSAMVISKATQAGFTDIADLTPYKIPVGSGIMVDKGYLASHRDAILRFLKADIEATRLMQEDPHIFNAALARWFNINDQATQAGMFALVHKFEKKPYPSVEGVRQALAVYGSAGTKGFAPDTFYDSSLIADLDKAGFLDTPK